MQELIDNISSEKLQSASIKNMAAFYSIYGRGEGCALVSTPSNVSFYSGLPAPIFNGVVSINMTNEDVQSTAEDLQAKLNKKGGPAMWWVGPQTTPENIDALLKQRGLQPAGETPNMVVALAALAALGAMQSSIENFRIEKVNKVNNPEGQALWVRTAAKGFGVPDPVGAEIAELEATFNDAHYKAAHHYIGYLNDVPVAASSRCWILALPAYMPSPRLQRHDAKGLGQP
ncbi:MAG: hypothetical protein WBO46_16280 [Caldilineaceae bacterium]